jgi:hypothetical protein
VITTALKTVSVSALLILSTSALSLDLSEIVGGGNKKAIQKTYDAQKGLVKQFNKAAKDVAHAQKIFASALGLKKKAAAIEAESKALKSGAVDDKNAMKRFSKRSGATNKAILAKIKKTDQLSEKAKKKFAKGFKPFFSGLAESQKISSTATGFVENAINTISAASVVEKVTLTKNLQPGLYVAQEMPGFAVNLYNSSKTLIAFAESQGIEVPDDALVVGNFN